MKTTLPTGQEARNVLKGEVAEYFLCWPTRPTSFGVETKSDKQGSV